MARSGSFRSQTKGASHGARTHPLESIARRFGYQEYERQLGKQLERQSARAQVPVTRQEVRAKKSTARTEALGERLTASVKDTRAAAQRVGELRSQKAGLGLFARQQQALAEQQRELHEQAGVPLTSEALTLQRRADLASEEQSRALRELRQAKADFQTSRRRSEELQRRTTYAASMNAATAHSVKVIADWQNANLEANRLRARRKLVGWT